MSEVENTPSVENGTLDLQAEVASLRQQVWTLLVLLFVISGTFTFYLFRQTAVNRKDLQAYKPGATQFIQQFQKEAPGMDQFIQRLGEYGRTHPDFVPILNKYKIPVTAGPAPTPAATAPKK